MKNNEILKLSKLVKMESDESFEIIDSMEVAGIKKETTEVGSYYEFRPDLGGHIFENYLIFALISDLKIMKFLYELKLLTF